MPEAVQCLWIGRSLSPLEQLSIRSFLANGHEVILYVYEQIDGVPKGTRIRDASRILPRSMQFVYKEHPSYAGFSNFFRYRLLLDEGGWWVDLDNICLRPMDFAAEYVFSSEDIPGGGTQANVGAIKAPAGSAVMSFLWQQCQSIDVRDLSWGQCGPALMARAIEQHELEEFVLPPQVFCPLPWWEWRNVLVADPTCEFFGEPYTVHLWNEMWRRANVDKSARYSPACLYERLRRRYPPHGELATRRSRLGWSWTWGTLQTAPPKPESPRPLDCTMPRTKTETLGSTSDQSSAYPGPTVSTAIRVSAVVLTRNGAQRIERCLRSILASGFADEVVVCIDRATTDNTYEIARNLADQVYFVATRGYLESALPQMASLCSGDFILRLDDDERLGGNWTRDTFESLVALNHLSHFTLLRRWVVDGGENFIASAPWFPDLQLRLFRNVPESIRWPQQIHEPMEIAGQGLTPGDRWIEHDVLFTASAAEREEKCRTYRALRPECSLSHFYRHEEAEVLRLSANEQGFQVAMKQLCSQTFGVAAPVFPFYKLGEQIHFEAERNGSQYTLSGWSPPEPWGTWTDARTAILQLFLREKPVAPLLLKVEAKAYTCANHPVQAVRVECGGEFLGSWTFVGDTFEGKSLVIPEPAIAGSARLSICFHLVNPASPAEFGESDDLRLLGMALRSLTVETCANSFTQQETSAAAVGQNCSTWNNSDLQIVPRGTL